MGNFPQNDFSVIWELIASERMILRHTDIISHHLAFRDFRYDVSNIQPLSLVIADQKMCDNRSRISLSGDKRPGFYLLQKEGREA